MKKIIIGLLLVSLAFNFTACKESSGDSAEVGDSVDGNDDGNSNSQSDELQNNQQEEVGLSYPENYIYRNKKGLFGNTEYDKSKILTITILDSLENMPDNAWDVSEFKDGRVMAWVKDDTKLYFAGEGGVTAGNCEGLFADFANLTTIEFNDCFYTDIATNFNEMFDECYFLTELDLSCFNTSNAETMNRMFSYCCRLEKIDISSFNTSKVTDMSRMFDNCRNLVELDLSSFDTSNVENMYWMFNHCMLVESIELGSFNTSKVTNFEGMFRACWVVPELDLSGFDFSSATTCKEMFLCCELLTNLGCELSLPSGIDTTDMYDRSGLE